MNILVVVLDMVMGMGMNVNWNPTREESLPYPATSLLNETGSEISRSDLLIEILRAFDIGYQEILAGKREKYYERWNELSMIIGRSVEIRSDKERMRGKAVRIDLNGALILEDEEGREQKILAGDVSVKL